MKVKDKMTIILESIQHNFKAFGERLDLMEERWSKKFDNLTEMVAQNTQDIAELKYRIGQIEKRLDRMEKRVESIEIEIKAIHQELKGKVEQDKYVTLEKRVGVLEVEVEKLIQ